MSKTEKFDLFHLREMKIYKFFASCVSCSMCLVVLATKNSLQFELKREFENKFGGDTYRTDETISSWWDDMEWRVNILVILPYIQHHSLTQWRCDTLSLDRNAILVQHRAIVQHNVILLITALEWRERERNRLITHNLLSFNLNQFNNFHFFFSFFCCVF
jgi:hypothetical protein